MSDARDCKFLSQLAYERFILVRKADKNRVLSCDSTGSGKGNETKQKLGRLTNVLTLDQIFEICVTLGLGCR